MANDYDSNSLCTPEEKALLLALVGGSASDKDALGAIADGLEVLGLIKRSYGLTGEVMITITGKGNAFLRVWQEEDSNSG